MNANRGSRQSLGTISGIFALLLWSSTIAFARGLAEQLGILTSAAATLMLGGAAGVIILAFSRGRLRAVWSLPRNYLLGCGALVVTYMAALYLAIGLAAGRQQVIEVGLINYLWPGLTLLLAVPVQGRKARWTLYPGVLLAFAGVVIATLANQTWGGADTLANQTWGGAATLANQTSIRYWLPCFLALLAAAAWALYSNLSRHWGADADEGAMPFFLLAAGMVMTALAALFPETPHWSASSLVMLAYMALGPTLLAYGLWDFAMRKGRQVLLASISYLVPLISTIISCLYLEVAPGWGFWAGCLLVIGGAVICNASLQEFPSPTNQTAGSIQSAP